MRASTEQPGWAPVAAVLVPLTIYALTASGHGYWLDSGEFTAAAVWLDIAHPPGHPLASLWGKLFTSLPVGPLPYRVALAQAVAAALALGFVQVAVARSLAQIGLADRHARGLLALGASWALGGTYGFWFQGVRAEVYALEALLVCIALERLSLLACCNSPRDPRPLYLACLSLGLGLANHHFIALLALPPLAWPLTTLSRTHGARVFVGGLAAGLLGLVCYVYLPLRAATEPPMDLGHPLTLRDFLWVVSAQVYARHIGSEAHQPLGERFADLLVLLIENFTVAGVLLAALGAYALVRARRTWPLAYLWLVTALVSLCGRAYLNPVRANPDVLGYMMPGFAALAALAATALAVLAASLPDTRGARRFTRATAGLVLLATLSQFPREAGRASLAGFHATDDFDDLRFRMLPTRSLVVLSSPDTVFRYWEGRAVEQLRGDTVLLPLPFLGYGGLNEAILRKHPALRGAIEDFMHDGALSSTALDALARTRPVFVELDTRTSLALYGRVRPAGLLYRVHSEPRGSEDLARDADRADALLARLERRVGADASERETRLQLLLARYVEALYLASRGERARALHATARGLALAPHTRHLRLLERMLRADEARSFDELMGALGHLAHAR